MRCDEMRCAHPFWVCWTLQQQQSIRRRRHCLIQTDRQTDSSVSSSLLSPLPLAAAVVVPPSSSISYATTLAIILHTAFVCLLYSLAGDDLFADPFSFLKRKKCGVVDYVAQSAGQGRGQDNACRRTTTFYRRRRRHWRQIFFLLPFPLLLLLVLLLLLARLDS